LYIHKSLPIDPITNALQHPSSLAVNNEPYAHSCDDSSHWYTLEYYELQPLP